MNINEIKEMMIASSDRLTIEFEREYIEFTNQEVFEYDYERGWVRSFLTTVTTYKKSEVLEIIEDVIRMNKL